MTPAAFLTLDDPTLRAIGFSRQKAGYARDLAFALDDGFDLGALARLTDDDARTSLMGLRGIGRWTADMLLLFCLGRPDVLPVGDLGVQNSMRLAYRLDVMPAPATMEEIAEAWRPYRSAGTWYLWRRSDMVTL